MRLTNLFYWFIGKSLGVQSRLIGLLNGITSYSCLLLIISSTTYGQQWNATNNEFPNSYVRALRSDTLNNILYVGGTFDMVGSNNFNNFALWDGNNWGTLGAGTEFSGGTASGIDDVIIYNGKVYASGDFINPGNAIAVWDGVNWAGVSNGVYASTAFGNANISRLIVFNGELFLTGAFRFINVPTTWDTVNSIATWDEIQFNRFVGINGEVGLYYPFSPPGFEGIDFTIHNNNLIVCGFFNKVTGININTQVAKYDGGSWSSVGSVLPLLQVNSVCSYNGDLYAAGLGNDIFKFDGINWVSVGTLSGLSNVIYAMHVYHGSLVIAGVFDSINGVSAKNIARYNGQSWTPMGAGITNSTNSAIIYSLETFQDNLYVGGAFNIAGGFLAENIAYWSEPTNVNEISYINKLDVFPNPTHDIVSLQLEMPKQWRCTIFNSLNEVSSVFITPENQNKIEIDCSHLKKGIYFILVEDIYDFRTRKFGKFAKY